MKASSRPCERTKGLQSPRLFSTRPTPIAQPARSHSYASMDAMRVQTLIALCSVVVATSACGTHELMAPNGHGNKAEIPENVSQYLPENVFPQAALLARNCDEKRDLASCHYLGWMLAEGAPVPVDHADETDRRLEGQNSPHVREPKYAPVAKNEEAANALFKAACDGGWTSACTSLVERGAAENPAELIGRACAQGEANACSALVTLAQSGTIQATSAQLNAQLEAACNAGRTAACAVQVDGESRYGQATQAQAENPTLLEVRRSGRGTSVVAYTDNAAEGRAIGQRAREAFGDDVDFSVKPAQGAVGSQWLEDVPALLVLSKGAGENLNLRLRRDSLTLNTVITDQAKAKSVRDALTRIGGEGRTVTANLDPVPEGEQAPAAGGGNQIGGESSDAVRAE